MSSMCVKIVSSIFDTGLDFARNLGSGSVRRVKIVMGWKGQKSFDLTVSMCLKERQESALRGVLKLLV